MSEIRTVTVGDVDLAYETRGNGGDPPVVLVMGLGGQMHYWHDGFVGALTDRGLLVVRFDNRDVGLSTHLTDAGSPDLMALMAGTASPPYTLSDLAGDVVGLVGALGHESAHLVGISLGGMIVQTAAVEHPDRVRSLVSISSTTGDPSVGAGKEHALAALFARPEPTREALAEHAVAISRIIGSPGFRRDEEWLAWRARRAFDHGHDPDGSARQAAAALTAADRTDRLRDVRVPALVIHGDADPLVDVSGGRATAEALPDAELLVIEGLGHDMPPGVWDRIADAIAATVRRAESARA